MGNADYEIFKSQPGWDGKMICKDCRTKVLDAHDRLSRPLLSESDLPDTNPFAEPKPANHPKNDSAEKAKVMSFGGLLDAKKAATSDSSERSPEPYIVDLPDSFVADINNPVTTQSSAKRATMPFAFASPAKPGKNVMPESASSKQDPPSEAFRSST